MDSTWWHTNLISSSRVFSTFWWSNPLNKSQWIGGTCLKSAFICHTENFNKNLQSHHGHGKSEVEFSRLVHVRKTCSLPTLGLPRGDLFEGLYVFFGQRAQPASAFPQLFVFAKIEMPNFFTESHVHYALIGGFTFSRMAAMLKLFFHFDLWQATSFVRNSHSLKITGTRMFWFQKQFQVWYTVPCSPAFSSMLVPYTAYRFFTPITKIITAME